MKARIGRSPSSGSAPRICACLVIPMLAAVYLHSAAPRSACDDRHARVAAQKQLVDDGRAVVRDARGQAENDAATATQARDAATAARDKMWETSNQWRAADDAAKKARVPETNWRDAVIAKEKAKNDADIAQARADRDAAKDKLSKLQKAKQQARSTAEKARLTSEVDKALHEYNAKRDEVTRLLTVWPQLKSMTEKDLEQTHEEYRDRYEKMEAEAKRLEAEYQKAYSEWERLDGEANQAQSKAAQSLKAQAAAEQSLETEAKKLAQLQAGLPPSVPETETPPLTVIQPNVAVGISDDMSDRAWDRLKDALVEIAKKPTPGTVVQEIVVGTAELAMIEWAKGLSDQSIVNALLSAIDTPGTAIGRSFAENGGGDVLIDIMVVRNENEHAMARLFAKVYRDSSGHLTIDIWRMGSTETFKKITTEIEVENENGRWVHKESGALPHTESREYAIERLLSGKGHGPGGEQAVTGTGSSAPALQADLATASQTAMPGAAVAKFKPFDQSTGQPVTGLELTLMPLEQPKTGEEETPRTAGSEIQGTHPLWRQTVPGEEMQITGLPPGRYDVYLRSECHQPTVMRGVTLGSGSSEIRIPVRPKPATITTLVRVGLDPDVVDDADLETRATIDFAIRDAIEQAGYSPADVNYTWESQDVSALHGDLERHVTAHWITIHLMPRPQMLGPDNQPLTAATSSVATCAADIPRTETPLDTWATGKPQSGLTRTDETTQPRRWENVWTEPDIPRQGELEQTTLPDDPWLSSKGSWRQSYDDQWALKRIGLPLPIEGQPVVVAVVDSGCDATHPDLAGALWRNDGEVAGNGVDDDGNGYVDDVTGWNFIHDNNDIADDNGHGTMNAGIIAARTGNGIGIAGVNPLATIMPLKVLDFGLKGGSAFVAKAIFYAADMGARVINVSIGGETLSRSEQLAINYARSKGALVVAAAGNKGRDTVGYSPAGLQGVVTVSAIGPDGHRTNFSNWGQHLDMAAPGVDVLSLRAHDSDLLVLSGPEDYRPGTAIVGKDRLYYRVTGTSFAAPLVSGVASLLYSRQPSLTTDQVERMLLQSADDIEVPGWDQYTGYGLANARKALEADPDYYTVAKIAALRTAKLGQATVVEVFGMADSSDFKSAWLELGLGERPTEWKRIGDVLKKPVSEGTLGYISPKSFTAKGLWTVRVLVETHQHGSREAWGTLTIK